MPTQKLFDRYDKRLIDLLDSAVKAPVAIRRKFRTHSKVYTFRMHLYQLRFAARIVGKKAKWNALQFHIVGTDLVLGAGADTAFSALLDDVMEAVDVDIGHFAEVRTQRRRTV